VTTGDDGNSVIYSGSINHTDIHIRLYIQEYRSHPVGVEEEMNVKELIGKLQEYAPDTEVFLNVEWTECYVFEVVLYGNYVCIGPSE
jgi:hypothetical protein